MTLSSFDDEKVQPFASLTPRRDHPKCDFALRPAYPSLAEDLQSVLSSGQEFERRIEQTGEEQSHLVRIVPYRVQKDAIAGVVVTFVAMPSGD